MTGGYQILDFSGYFFNSEEEANVSGIYEKATSEKPLLISGLIIDDIKFNDFWITFEPETENEGIKSIYAEKQLSQTTKITCYIDENDNITFISTYGQGEE